MTENQGERSAPSSTIDAKLKRRHPAPASKETPAGSEPSKKKPQRTNAQQDVQRAAQTEHKSATPAKSHKRHNSRRKKSSTPSLRVIPLGGLDGIGKNMMVLECGDDMVLVDAGLMFPDDDHLGVDLILPDYTYVLENVSRLRGILITHGHEDHTGALPYLLKDIGAQVPIFGSKMTLGLIEGKLAEHKLMSPLFHEVSGGETVTLGCFSVSFFAVNHSIPGAFGIYFKTPAGTLLHTGDFKLDQTPIDGVTTDFAALCHYGHLGVDLMLSDSTNAQNLSFTRSESEVGKELRSIIKNAEKRVLVASFSSHIHRVQQVCDAAVLAGRKVAVTGRSMLTNTKIARDLGYLHVSEGTIIDAYEAKDIPSDKVVVLCTGSQGEPLSALARMANGEHRTISIEEGDTVIISATPVPGNEKAVTRVLNGLTRIGAKIYDKNNALVHVSGHAGSEELKIVLTMVKPKYFMPVHGEPIHLKAHADIAHAVGIPKSNVFILDNGDSLTLENHQVKRGETVETGVVFVEGISVGDTNQVVLRDRKLLANDGIATIIVMLDSKKQMPVGDIEIIMRGVAGGDEKALLAEAHACVTAALKSAIGTHGMRRNMVQREVKDALAKLLWDRCRRRPMIIPVVMEI